MQSEGQIVELCHVARNMDAALQYWTKTLGAGPFYVFDVPVLPGQLYYGEPTEVSLKVAFGFSGGLLIELLAQTNDGPSPFKDFLDIKGDGLHHVMRRIPYDEGVRQYSDAGYRIAFSGQLPSGERFCLFDAMADHGHYIEFMDFSPANMAMLGKIHQAHLDWDGTTDPVRDMASLFA